MCTELKWGTLPWVCQDYEGTLKRWNILPYLSVNYFPPLPIYPLPQSTEFCVIEPYHLKKDGDDIIRVPNGSDSSRQATVISSQGNYYKVQDKCLVGKGGKSGQEYTIADVILDSIPQKTVFLDRYGEAHVCYTCILKSDKWGAEAKTFEVKAEDIFQLYNKVREKYPEIMLLNKGADAISENISDVVAAWKDKMKTKYSYEVSGWYEEADGVDYHIGTHSEYARWRVPEVAHLNMSEKYQTFIGGYNFLNVGHRGPEIMGLFLYAHMCYSLYWFRRAGYNINFLLYLKGWTGSLKTALLVELVNTFEPDVMARHIQLTDSSWARLRELLLLHQDAILFIDDYAKTQKELSRDGAITIEKIARSIGNGKLSEKMKPGGTGSQITAIRSLVVLTGEDDPELGNSSFLRMLTIAVQRGTFDGRELKIFQENRELMSFYFALYVEFLRANADTIIEIVQRGKESYFAECETLTEEPRLRETAICLRIQLDLIAAFGLWCGAKEAEMREFREVASKHIATLIRDNTQERARTSIENLFVKALWEQVTNGSKYQLAESGEVYHKDYKPFYIGFYDMEHDFIWVKMEDALKAVTDYCSRHGLYITQNDNIIKPALHKRGVLVKPKKGWVWRWTQGQCRGRFIKLRISVIKEIVEEED